MKRRALVATVVLLLSSGCFARFDGEWPIGRSDDGWREVGGGESGVLLRAVGDARSHRIASSRGVLELRATRPLDGALVAGGSLWHLDGPRIVEYSVAAGRLGEGRVVDRVEGARLLAVGAGEVAVATPGLVVAGEPGALRGVWEGDAAALAVDSERRRLWIVGRGGLRAIDCIDLDRRAVLLRVPLPPQLDSPSVRIVLSGGSAAIYALDRPIQHALLVAPEEGRALPLLATAANEVEGGACDDGSVPPFITPAPYTSPRGEQPAGADPTDGFAPRGRVVPFPGDRFLVVDAGGGRFGGIGIVLVAGRPREGCAPARKVVAMPDDGPSRVEGVAWDGEGAVLTCRDQRIVVRAESHVAGEPTRDGAAELVELNPGTTVVRRAVNRVLNVFVLTGEIALGTTMVAAAAGLVVGTAPIWIWPVLASAR